MYFTSSREASLEHDPCIENYMFFFVCELPIIRPPVKASQLYTGVASIICAKYAGVDPARGCMKCALIPSRGPI